MVDFQNLLNKYKIKADINMLLDMWCESHRHYHNIEHLNDLVSQINEKYESNKIDEKQKELLSLVALFHDIIYEPGRFDNEERSADFFQSLCEDKASKDILTVKIAILDTKEHNCEFPLSEMFNKLDMSICESNFDRLVEWEKGIGSEYVPVFGELTYQEGRIGYLESLLDKYPNNSDNLLKLIDWIAENY